MRNMDGLNIHQDIIVRMYGYYVFLQRTWKKTYGRTKYQSGYHCMYVRIFCIHLKDIKEDIQTNICQGNLPPKMKQDY